MHEVRVCSVDVNALGNMWEGSMCERKSQQLLKQATSIELNSKSAKWCCESRKEHDSVIMR